MPERKAVFRVATTRAQGADSWIDYIPRTIEEALGLVDMPYANNLEEVKARVLRWNWVDKDGNKLPMPEDDPEKAWAGVLTPELSILAVIVTGIPTADDLKN
jgi:hypothetical protein